MDLEAKKIRQDFSSGDSDAIINFGSSSLTFQGYGCGAQGENLYDFKLEFFKEIDTEKSSYKLTGRNVFFEVYKRDTSEEWKRLLKAPMKPVWLRIDFDKWKIEESEEEEKGERDLEEQINKITFEQRVKSELEKAQDDIKVWTKLVWLTVYNLMQFICFTIIFGKLVMGLWKHGEGVTSYFYDDVSDLLLTCQIAAFIEVINPMIGVVKTGLLAPFMQVFGRSFILFILLIPEKRFHEDPVVFVLFFAWSFIEVVRYPFYLLGLYRYNSKLLVWLRYNIWIPLYPSGFIAEAIIMIKSLPFSEEKKRFEYNMPNKLNFIFTLKGFTQFYLVVYIPLCLYMLKHMWRLRQRKLGIKPTSKPKQA